MSINIAEFIKDRNAALFSFDRRRIEGYMRKYHLIIPESETMFWVNTAKSVLSVKDAPEEAKLQAWEILNKYKRSEYPGRCYDAEDLW